jgi:predicted DNA repair protein MutK
MASGVFLILDDIASLMDDVASLTNIAAKKTAGILGDDLAVNAEKATGFVASRELHVLWAITKGSLINKVIILPLAFLLSSYLPQLIVPILLLGGIYLCYEGGEKVVEWIFSHNHQHKKRPIKQASNQPESTKIKAAIRTDFILSIEIIIIALATVIDQTLKMQIITVSIIALLATVGVYGIVALLVRMDDAGLYLIANSNDKTDLTARLGQKLVIALPVVIRLLGIIGTVAMLLVGGGMFVHNIELIHHVLHPLPSLLADLVAGLCVGFITVTVMHFVHARSKSSQAH